MIVFKYIWYYFFWLVVKVGLAFYFKRIKIAGLENVPKNAPVIFGANHENAFMDALIITTRLTRFSHYLVRADVFKNALVKTLFSWFNMLPVYRIRDGFGSIKGNQEIFQSCYNALAKGRALIMFPEGKHDIRRISRELTKGISRIALGAVNSENAPKELYVVPVGLNYTDHKLFRSSVHVVFGEAIKVEKATYDARSLDTLRNEINEGLINCTIGLQEAYYDQLDTLVFKTEGGYDLSDPKPINTRTNNLLKCYIAKNNDGLDLAIEEFDEILKNLGVKNWESIKDLNTSYTFLRLLLLLPVYLFGLIHNLIPMILIESLIALKVEDKVFTASIKFSVGLFLFPLFWFLEAAYFNTYNPSIYLYVIYWCSLPFSLLIVNYYHKTVRLYWAKRKLEKNPEMAASLNGCLDYIDEFKAKCS
ncbi:lysophospholipid acyltransferase family protein [Reichenbachiella sp. MALMAid0571]|uniref:lysophospholipid acyltransferase family protein n=1 Tax=Reichenbachiella sp. MALMAid0571 TaxID=3143939 RepID=UPI0032DED664